MAFAVKCQGKTRKKIMRPVMVGLHLLIVNIHVAQEESEKKMTSTCSELHSTPGELCGWFKESHIVDILAQMKPILVSRINSASSNQSLYENKELKSVSGVAVSYKFKKRSSVSGQHFALLKSDSAYCFCGKKVLENNVGYKGCPVFHESLEVTVKCSEKVDLDECNVSTKHDVLPLHEISEDATSSYFSKQNDSMQTSSVKRKKTTIRKMAKKSRIALIEMPSYVTRTAVIDLEKEPEGLKDIKRVEDLREDHLKFLINQMEDYLRTIFRGEVYSRRHEDFKKGGKFRDDLNFQVGMAHFTEDQHECILSMLAAMFCRKDQKYLDYVTKVMLPEALIKLYQDIHKTSFKEAEECLWNDTILEN